MKLNINGKKTTVEADEAMPLLWVLRDLLNMTGTKFGCGKGLCGACTVLLDGTPVRSCSFSAKAAEGKKITTIEGVEKDYKYVQEAWAEFNVPQCGYCQSGQIMSAIGLLRENKQPNDKDIEAAMSGNICRCGTYGRIKKAIKRSVELKNQ